MSKNKKIVVFDGQVFQSAAWDRGMGKYSVCLLGAIAKSSVRTYEKTYIIFTKKFELEDAARQVIQRAAPNAELVFLDLMIPNIHDHDSIKPLEEHNKKVVTDFIKLINEGKEDKLDFVILALFIDQVCSVFPLFANKILLFYDLIPLQYSERYGLFHSYSNYLARFETIFEADYIWTISQTVADDLMVHTGISSNKLCNINGAPIERSHEIAKEPKNVNIPKRFLLMPSGNDLRKNNERTAKGFREYCQQHPEDDIYLVITSFFDEETRSILRKESDKLIFTGNVSEGELQWLYEHTQALLFAPEYEGLGLPILEAIEADRRIICSNLTVFNEMSKTAFYYADQFNPLSIANAIDEALVGYEWKTKHNEYESILKRYTWPATADAALNFINKSDKTSKIEKRKYKIAIFTPDPSGYSAIGKFNLHLHPSLSDLFEIDYFVERGITNRSPVRPSYLGNLAKTFEAKEFNAKTYSQYDAVVYHIGNSEFHMDTIKNALHLPGYAIMHDTNLGPIFKLLSNHYITDERLQAEGRMNKLLRLKKGSYITSIVNTQLGVIGHSEYSVEAIKEASIDDTIGIFRSNLPVAVPVMEKMKIEKTFSIGFAGIIHPAKGINLIDEIISSGLFSDVSIYLFGIPLVSDDELSRLESLPNVKVLTNLTDFQFQQQLAAIDVIVNYRPNYNGEASAATVEAMRAGVVPIVRKIGWFDELPDDSVVKVESENEVITVLSDLYNHPEKLTSMATNARRVMEESFSQKMYAEHLYEIIDNNMKKKSHLSKNQKIHEALINGSPKDTIISIIDK